ncbi:hypothetical protein ERJ75_001245100 [Trypanosoma vivax]|nr:hypothetical protein ERJ75_001245100 [Trypanosoma vivax]
MRRDDYERRRIRDIYDRNVRRVRALADARDRYRTDRDGDVLAPRRFIVSERRSRLEGFGYGDRRPDDRYWSRAHGSYRFDDRRVYRRVGLGRFVREDDYDREYRRERARSRDVERYRRGYGPRFGRLRLRPREIRQSRMYGGRSAAATACSAASASA